MKNRGPPYCYWQKITSFTVTGKKPNIILLPENNGKYPMIYQGFIHNISHYLQGFIHIISHYVPGFYIYPKWVVVLWDFFEVKPMDSVDPNPFPSRGVAGLPGNEESFDKNNR